MREGKERKHSTLLVDEVEGTFSHSSPKDSLSTVENGRIGGEKEELKIIGAWALGEGRKAQTKRGSFGSNKRGTRSECTVRRLVLAAQIAVRHAFRPHLVESVVWFGLCFRQVCEYSLERMLSATL